MQGKARMVAHHLRLLTQSLVQKISKGQYERMEKYKHKG